MLDSDPSCPFGAFLDEIVYYQGVFVPRGIAIETEHALTRSRPDTLRVAAREAVAWPDLDECEVLDPDIARATLQELIAFELSGAQPPLPFNLSA